MVAKDLVRRLMEKDCIKRFTVRKALGRPWIGRPVGAPQAGTRGGAVGGSAALGIAVPLAPQVLPYAASVTGAGTRPAESFADPPRKRLNREEQLRSGGS